MFCSACGKEISNEAKFCSGCGSPIGVVQNKTVEPINENLAKLYVDIKPIVGIGGATIKIVVYLDDKDISGYLTSGTHHEFDIEPGSHTIRAELSGIRGSNKVKINADKNSKTSIEISHSMLLGNLKIKLV